MDSLRNERNVSVIIPVYNVVQYLNKTVASALDQNEVGEIILVDDYSTDGSYELCIELAEKCQIIKVLTHPNHVNLGISESRNLGVSNASMPYIAFLDSDDYYLPGRFTQAIRYLSDNNIIDGVYEQVGVLQSDNLIVPFAEIQPVAPEDLFDNLQPVGSNVWFHCNGLTIRRYAFMKAGAFDPRLATSEDSLHWFKLAAKCKLAGLFENKWVAIHVKRADSISTDLNKVYRNYMYMFYLLLVWCMKENISKEKIDKIFKKFMFELFERKDQTDTRLKLKYLLNLFMIDPLYFINSKTYRLYIGKIIGYV